MKISYFLLFVILNFGTTAQTPCTADLNKAAGKWKQVQDYYNPFFNYKAKVGSFSKTAADAMANKLLEIIKKAYPSPAGCNANFSKQFPFAAYNPKQPFGYFQSTGFFNFYCENNRLKEIEATSVWLKLEVNSFIGTFFASAVTAPQDGPGDNSKLYHSNVNGNYTVNGKTVYALPAESGTFRETDYFSADNTGKEKGGTARQYFIIRKKEKPVFIPVTRKEYIIQFKKEIADYAQKEINRKKAWLKSYPGDESTAQNLPVFEKMMTAYMKAVDGYLNKSTGEELNKPVWDLLPQFPADTENPVVAFTSYTKKQLYYFNEYYMDSKLPLHVPQFMILELRAAGNDGDRRYQWRWELRDKIMNELSLDDLKSLLNK